VSLLTNSDTWHSEPFTGIWYLLVYHLEVGVLGRHDLLDRVQPPLHGQVEPIL
jgi:hypothetical protein